MEEKENKYVPITEDMDPDDLVIFIPDDEEKTDHFVLKVFIGMIIFVAIVVVFFVLLF